MSDLIDRQAAIEALADYIHNVDAVYDEGRLPNEDCIDAARSVLDELPSVQRWIPCSERPPEDGTEVFVYLFDSQSPYIAWIEDAHWHTEDFEIDREDEPIAWMPLPEPYKGE